MSVSTSARYPIAVLSACVRMFPGGGGASSACALRLLFACLSTLAALRVRATSSHPLVHLIRRMMMLFVCRRRDDCLRGSRGEGVHPEGLDSDPWGGVEAVSLAAQGGDEFGGALDLLAQTPNMRVNGARGGVQA